MVILTVSCQKSEIKVIKDHIVNDQIVDFEENNPEADLGVRMPNCDKGGIWIREYQWINSYCVPDLIYRLDYLGANNPSINWTISAPNGSFNFANGTNQFSRPAYIRYSGCGYLHVTIDVDCEDGSSNTITKSIYHYCC